MAVAQVPVAQYGGILQDRASVLVVLDQWVRQPDGSVRQRGTTLDVRLVAAEPQWTVTQVRPAAARRSFDEASAAAKRLLSDDRVVLPRAARRDVRSGVVDDVVLRALTTLSERHQLDVSVLRSGHPLRVFGTSRTSDHTVGRAVDVWALDGRSIVDLGGSPVVTRFLRAASDAGAYQIGGPVDLDDVAARYFADNTHQDHIHLGFLVERD